MPKNTCHMLTQNVSSVLKGKNDAIKMATITMLCGGHLLIEDLPGCGKTTLAKALAMSIDCTATRIQFTPDLLPSDITGVNMYNIKDNTFTFKKGAIFTNILLADEINRAAPRTQSALLECMEERQVTIDGNTYKLDEPFMVIATQNPIESRGTYPLPEAQLDRFFMRISMGYPDRDSEEEAIMNAISGTSIDNVKAVLNASDIIKAKEDVQKVKVSNALADYILAITEKTRDNSNLAIGLSTRGAIALTKAAMGYAYINERDYAIPDDVKAVAVNVIAHRLKLTHNMIGKTTTADVINDIIKSTKVPEQI